MLAALAWRNLWRQSHRTALSLASISLAAAITVFLLSLQQGAYGTMKQNVLHLVDGYAQIQPPGYRDDPGLRRSIAEPAPILAQLASLRGVNASAPRATAYAIVSSPARSYGAAVLGVDPAREADVSALRHAVARGRYLAAGDGDAAVVGSGLAGNLHLEVGSPLTLLGAARDGSVAADVLTVAGIFTTGVAELDRQVVEMPLSRFQADFAMGAAVNVIALSGRSLDDIQARLPELRRLAARDGLVVRDWTELEPALHDVILLDASIALLWYASLIVVVVFIILNTLLMSVLERTREFGVLLAMGMRAGQIGRMVWLELLFLAGAGAALGIAAGAAATAWAGAHGIPFPGAEALFAQWHMPSTLYPRLSAVTALAGPGAIALGIAVAGLVPYARIRRLEPVPAMRSA